MTEPLENSVGATGISEFQAREILADNGSAAADPCFYKTSRVAGGWLFRVLSDDDTPIIGMRSIVVTDSGNVARMGIGEAVAQTVSKADRQGGAQ